jgi:cytochrome c-type biogenesis protein
MTVGARSHTFLHALAFVCGFSLVFVLLGASVAFIGYSINTYLPLIERIGGVVLILFGLQVLGALEWVAQVVRRGGGSKNTFGRAYLALEDGLSRIMYAEGRVQVKSDRRWGYLSSVMMGVFFSAGWIPCVGPVLAAIYLLASNMQTAAQGALLLLAYSLGLGIPFLVTGAALSTMTGWLRRINRHLGIISKITGIFLLFMGFLLLTEQMTLINSLIVGRFGTGLAGLDLGGNAAALTLPIALAAGLLSFLSPCVLPLIPGYISYLSGTAVVGSAGVDKPATVAKPGRSAGQPGEVR